MNIRLSKISESIIALVVVSALVFGFAQTSNLFAAFSATNILGQTDGSGNAVYTEGGINDSISPNGDFALMNPGGSTWDSSHNIFWVVDTAGNRVAGYNTDPNGHPQDYYIDYVIGQADMYSSGTGLSDHQLSSPADVVYDSSTKYLYVSDSGNNRIMVFDTSFMSQFGISASYVIGQADFVSNGAATSISGLSNPTALEINKFNGDLYVVDANNYRVLFFPSPVTDGEDASMVIGQTDYISRHPSVSVDAVSFGLVNDVAYGRQDDGTDLLYISDFANNRVMIFKLGTNGNNSLIHHGMAATSVIGQPDLVTTDYYGNCSAYGYYLCGPVSLAYDFADGTIYVGDGYQGRVIGFNLVNESLPFSEVQIQGQLTDVIGNSDFNGSLSGKDVALAVPFSYMSVSVSGGSTSILHVSDATNYRVLNIDIGSADIDPSFEEPIQMLGQDLTGGFNPSLAVYHAPLNNHITSTGFDSVPNGSQRGALALDTVDHRIFVADRGNNRVLEFDLSASNTISNRYADHVIGQADMGSDAYGLSQSRLRSPEGITYYVNGNTKYLFVADSQNNRVLVFEGSPLNVSDGMNALFVIGQTDFVSDLHPKPSDSSFNTPRGLVVATVNGTPYLFVCDTGNHRILAFDISSNSISTGMSASFVIGQPDFIASDLSLSSTGVARPESLTWDGSHTLYVSDTSNNRVLSFDLNNLSNGMAASHVLGASDLSSAPHGGVAANSFNEPKGLSYNSSNGLLYIADSGNNRVLAFDVSNMVDDMNAVSVLGQSDFVSNTPNTTQDGLNGPAGLQVDTANNRVWVVDSNNNRVMVYDIAVLSSSTGNRYGLSLSLQNIQGSPQITAITGDYPSGMHFVSASGAAGLSGKTELFGTFSFAIDQIVDTITGGLNFYSNKNIPVSFTISEPINTNLSLDSAYTATHITTPSGRMGGVAYKYITQMNGLDHVDYGRYFYTLSSRGSFCMTNNPLHRIDGSDSLPGSSDLCLNVSNDSGASHLDLNFPTAIAVSSAHNQSGDIFIADTKNNRVVKLANNLFDQSVENVVGVYGQANMGTKGDFISPYASGTTQSTMRFPQGLAVDEIRDLLFVADTGNNRVLVFNNVDSNTIGSNAAYVLGQSLFTTREYGYGLSEMSGPTDLEFDPDTKMLYVLNEGDYGDRIQQFDTSRLENNVAAVKQVNSPYEYLSGLGYDPVTKRIFMGNPTIGTDVVYILNSGFNSPVTQDGGSIDLAGGAGFIGTNTTSLPTFISMTGDGSDSSHFGEPHKMAFDSTRRTLGLIDYPNAKFYQFYFVHITKSSLSSGDVGTSYSDTITTENAQGVVAFSVASGSLPTGLSLNSSTGALTGTPTVAGTYTFTVDANDKAGGYSYPNFSDQHQYTILVTQSTPPSQCNDSIDNDGDGKTDYPTDPGCTSTSDDSEDDPVGSGGTPTQCSDGQDNDHNGFIDYPQDTGCSSATDTLEATPTTPTLPQCSDGVDNDENGLIDFPNDPSCTDANDTSEYDTTPITPAQCADGIDNDNNGKKDFPQDPGCSSAADDSEVSTPVIPVEPTDPVIPVTPPDNGTPVTPPVDPVTPITPVTPTTPDTPPSTPPTTPATSSDCFSILSSDASNYDVIMNQVHGTFCVTVLSFEQTLGYVKELMGTDGDILSKSIGTTGLIMGALFSILPYLFLAPFSFSEVALLPYRLWSLLVSAFGLKRRSRPWGTVYDSITKQPLDPAIVQLQDVEGNEVATSTTDLDGRYGFLVGPGKYRLLPKKTHYSFPSLKLIGKTRDELYLDLYFGYVFEVTEEGQVITKNIPMDPEGFDWNEFAKNEQSKMKFFSRRDRILNRVADVLFSIGFVVSLVALITAPTNYNIAIFALYIIMFILREVGLKYNSFGSVSDKEGNPLSFAIIRIFTPTGIEISHKVTNKTGRYYCLMSNGTYLMTIEKKNPDESYTKVYEGVHEVKHGVLKERVVV